MMSKKKDVYDPAGVTLTIAATAFVLFALILPAYDEGWNRIFGQKEIKELDESLKQSKANKKERVKNG